MGWVLNSKESKLPDFGNLLKNGHFKKTYNLITRLQKEKTLTKEEKLQIDKFKGLAMFELGETGKALQLMNSILSTIEKTNNPNLDTLAIFVKGIILQRTGRIDEAISLIDEELALLDSLKLEEPEKFLRRKANLLFRKGTIYFHLEKVDLSLELLNKSLSIRKKIDDKYGIAKCYEVIGYNHKRNGDLKKAIGYIKQSIAIFEEIGNKYQLSIELFHLGVIYYDKGQYTLAIKYMEQILPFINQMDNDFKRGYYLEQTGFVYLRKGDYELARKNFLKSLDIYQSINDHMRYGIVLYALIELEYKVNNISKAKEYLSLIKQLTSNNKDSPLKNAVNISEVLLLKDSPRSLDREKAEQLLRDIIDFGDPNVNFIVKALIYLCELLLHDFQLSGNLEILNEIKIYTDDLLDYAKEEKVYWIQMEAYSLRLFTLWVQAKFSDSELDMKEIRVLLSQTQQIAGKRGLDRIAKDIFEKHSVLIEQVQSLDDFIKNYYDFNVKQ